MSESIVEEVKSQMGALEALVKGLPGIRDYVDKDIRRSTDKRLREQVVIHLRTQRERLIQYQKMLLTHSGLKFVTQIDEIGRRLQTTIDRINTASYGYTGLFSDIRIREEQLNALYQFDQSLVEGAAAVESKIDQLIVASDSAVTDQTINALATTVAELEMRFAKRQEAILAPNPE
ncbi:MAG: hypothetical protein R2932_04930 [Caldilineaceae bacterium]